VSISEVAVVPTAPDTRRYKLTLRFDGEEQPARLGLLNPVEAARQVVDRGQARRAWGSAEAFETVSLSPGLNEFDLMVPDPWFPMSALVALELRGDSQGLADRVVEGPRSVAWRSSDEGTEAMDGARAQLAQLETDFGPRRVRIRRAKTTPTIDGRLEEGEWGGAPFYLHSSLDGTRVEDLVSRVYLSWDERALYVAAHLVDPDIWGEYEEDDSPIYKEEAFELFLGAGKRVRRYLEFQVSPRGVSFDAAFTDHRKGGEDWDGVWQRAVHVEGTVTKRADRDEYWDVELAFPWSTLCAETEIPCTPEPGMPFRMNAFRLDKDAEGRQRGQALTPTRKPDFHNWAEAAHVTLGDDR
jgi:hypothetical protein